MQKFVKLMVCLVAVSANSGPAATEESSLALIQGGITRHFNASEMLDRPDAADLSIVKDAAYKRAASYRAVPLLSLLSELPQDAQLDTLEARAADGFVAQIPLSLIRQATTGGAIPWIAIEPPAHPWPDLPGQTVDPGPFYLVWQDPERSGVMREQWPYQLVSLTVAESPIHRWPRLAADPLSPWDSPVRRGESVFVAECLPCHRLNGSGAAEAGPDLGSPMNVMNYLTEDGLRAIIRNPQAVRVWPLQQMPGFSPDILQDADLDALVAYLRQVASRSATPATITE